MLQVGNKSAMDFGGKIYYILLYSAGASKVHQPASRSGDPLADLVDPGGPGPAKETQLMWPEAQAHPGQMGGSQNSSIVPRVGMFEARIAPSS